MKDLGGGWRISEPYSTPKQADYVKRMVEETLAEGPRPTPLVPKEFKGKAIKDLTAAEREEFIFSMQAKSTQEAMLRQKTRKPEDDLEFLLRPIPESYLAKPDAKTKAELTGERSLSADAVQAFQSWRNNRSKNTRGESKAASVDVDKRERAIEAFTYSKPAEPSIADLKRLKKADPLEGAIAPEEGSEAKEKPPSGMVERFRLWFNLKFGDWIYGGKFK